MRHNLDRPVLNYKGDPFMKETQNPENPEGKIRVPLTLKELLEQACLQANPQKYATGEKKMEVYKLLRKISAADPFANLSAEDVTTLKALVGDNMSVAACGAVYEMLEDPVTSVKSVQEAAS